MDIEKMKASRIDFDRTPLEAEIDTKPECVGIFCLLPESIIRKLIQISILAPKDILIGNIREGKPRFNILGISLNLILQF